MTQVFVVTTGTYSDYRIKGIFTTQELADAYAAKITDYAYVEFWDLDEDNLTHAYTEVQMYRDGDVLRTDTTYREYEMDIGRPYFTESFPESNYSVLINMVETDSVERAVKVTNELRTRLLAEELWPGDSDAIYIANEFIHLMQH